MGGQIIARFSWNIASNLANFREKFNLPPRSNCHDMVLITAKGQQLHVSSKFRNCYYIDTLDGVLVIVKCWHLVSKHRRFACFLKVLSVGFFVYHAKSREWMRIDLYTRLFSITFLHYFCWYFFFWYLSLYFPGYSRPNNYVMLWNCDTHYIIRWIWISPHFFSSTLARQKVRENSNWNSLNVKNCGKIQIEIP